jgi:hypothetical protein
VTATNYSERPPSLRAAAYSNLAAQARREASMSKGSVRESYILIAMQWERLTAEATAMIKTEK